MPGSAVGLFLKKSVHQRLIGRKGCDIPKTTVLAHN